MDSGRRQSGPDHPLLEIAIRRLRRMLAVSQEQRDYGTVGVSISVKNGIPLTVHGEITFTEKLPGD